MQRMCQNNKEALRWCMARRAVIQFANWKAIKRKKHIPEGVTCSVSLGRIVKIDKTLLKTVNAWIRHVNKDRDRDRYYDKKKST